MGASFLRFSFGICTHELHSKPHRFFTSSLESYHISYADNFTGFVERVFWRNTTVFSAFVQYHSDNNLRHHTLSQQCNGSYVPLRVLLRTGRFGMRLDHHLVQELSLYELQRRTDSQGQSSGYLRSSADSQNHRDLMTHC